MEELRQHLKQIRVPNQNDKVYKDECVFSFDNPESDTGLYVSLNSFLGFGRDYVEKYYNKTQHAVFLHMKRERHEVASPPQGDGPEKKITRLAIGVEGGFDPQLGHKKFEFHDVYHVCVLPSFTMLPWPNPELPELVIQSVQTILDMQSASKKAELEALAGTWDGEARVVSKYAENLTQLDNGKKIPPSGWVCEKCDKTENLWLNLTDGSIHCGRKFYDGTGGNNHAIEHYETTKYPLAVKLGTITKEGKADIFSYAEDDMVEDPKLIEHLSHWGINMNNMEKTEKSMVELELELNQKTNEWAALQESGGKLTPMYGPGYTGMTNLGNSCYLNSVIQLLYLVPNFVQRYYANADTIFDSINGDPAEDFNCQMAKVAVGLLSGKYSVPPPTGSPIDADSPGISPLMFKTLVGRGNPDFSSCKQQDAVEYFMHLMSLIERNSRNQPNPGNAFKYKLEEKIQCNSSNKVKYTYRSDTILGLTIPLEAAVNKEEVAAYEARKVEAESQGKRLEPDSLVRPRIKFFSCLETLTQTEVIEQFYSTAINDKTTARKTTRLATFPDYLLIQLKKFTLREDWVPIKLDVAVEMPDVLDLNILRANGPQPGEETLPELASNVVVQPPSYDPTVMASLIEMGFPENACKRALYFTQNSGVETAMGWIMQHIADADFSDPFTPPGLEAGGAAGAVGVEADPEAVELIVGMGFTRAQATKALKNCNNNGERALDWIFSHPEELEDTQVPSEPEFKDGEGHYKLIGFVSHMGTSSMVGHYVVHVLKEGRWVIFNDNKVALSENPPKELGYMYLYQRI